MEEGVDRLEDVLQQVQNELSGVQDKMEDIKIEVMERLECFLVSNLFSRLLE